jgi:hypothetical protein
MTEYEVAEFMVKLDGTSHPAMLARPGSGVRFDGIKRRWVREADGVECTIPYDEIDLATFVARDQLMATCNKFGKKLKQPLLDLDTSHNWKEVEGA